MKKLTRFYATDILVALSVLLLTSCGGGTSPDTGGQAPQDTTIASIKIVPGAAMLTQVGEQQTLEAKAFNAAGDELDATFSWTSSHPDQIDITEEGVITAQTLGSAEFKAIADGVTSQSALALVTLPVANARMVTDEQIIGDLIPVDVNAPYGLGFQYQVTLRGVTAPDVGVVLLGTGEASVGGRVVAITQAGQDIIVTLEIISIPEMFDKLVFNEEIDLKTAPVTIPEAVSDFYTVQHNPDGSMLFTLKPDAPAVGQQGTASAARALHNIGGTFTDNPYHPFVCKFPSNNPSPFFSLNALSPTILLERDDMSLPVFYDPDTGDLSKLSLKGRAKVGFKVTNTITAQFEAKAACKYELTRITIPINGVLGLVYGGQVPLGLGFEVAGKVTLANVGFTLGAEAEATMELGMSCPPAAPSCEMISDFNVTGKATADLVMPNDFNPDAQLRFEPSLSGFAYAELKLGPSSSTLARLLSRLDIGAFDFKAGPTLGANLAPVKGQIIDTNYASDYKLSLDFKAGPSQDITPLLGILGVNLINAQITGSRILTTSPAAETVTVNTGDYLFGDVIDFNVKLDPTTVNFLPFIYNVDEVLIYRKIDDNGVISKELVASTTADDGQTDFDLSWVATSSSSSNDSFYAFASTRLLPIPLLGELELKKATVVGTQKIAFVSKRDGNNEIYVMNTDGSNQTKLTNNLGDGYVLDSVLVPSPDGSKIAFTTRDNNTADSDIFTINTDGSDRIQLTFSASEDNAQDWSPDGSKIVFIRSLNQQEPQNVYVINADGSGLNKLTNFNNSTFIGVTADWSPDGNKILFTTIVLRGEPDNNIYVMDADGSNQTKLTNNNGSIVDNPIWSPDSKKIIYEAWGENSEGINVVNLFIMDSDGSNQVNLTNDLYKQLFSAKFSPDGTQILFFARTFFSTRTQIFAMNTDGTNKQNLSNSSGDSNDFDSIVSWSPDGSKIVFLRSRDGDTGIYVMDADASNLTRLTQNDTRDFSPVWLP